MFGLSNNKLKEYTLPFGWRISFPKSWRHEFQQEDEGDQYLFFPKNDDLTFRITSFHVEKQGVNAPVDILIQTFLHNTRSLQQKKDLNFKHNDFDIECLEGITKENGKDINHVSCAIAVDGFLLTLNIFASKKHSIDQSLRFISSVCRSDYPGMEN